MYYLFDKTGKCATISPDEDKLKELIAEDDKESLILEDERWLNPSDLSVVDGKIKIATIVEPALSYVIRDGSYLATYSPKDTDTIVTEKPVDSTNSFISYSWDGTKWVTDKPTSLDSLNALYVTQKQQLHELHSAIQLSLALEKITAEEATTRTAALAAKYDTMWQEIITKQGVITNG